MLAPTEKTARVLVVDDDAAICELLIAMLRGAGYSVECAADGRAAIQRLAEAAFDLVITDLVMPEQEGIETIQILRKEFPHLKIVAVSGAFGGEYLRIARLLGAHAILEKPFSVDSLLAVVEETLAQAS